ncbi:neuromedin-U receptor 1-like [Corythoichthys intestinalis]|uniref:neuromedin-U receptor 1-like n=1 Tax=Corythoichthys intestinalis TaxID=161448 RepID=UPI0025A5752A|nr:neuromedin-U receptor 1-like [Corythoichthys intestinalis]XP_061794925.1 neuromedin-U receptor 1-like [Nerophis lumbriciformis]
MPELNCSRASPTTANASVDAGCPDHALRCIWTNASRFPGNDLDEICLSEDDYMLMKLGPPRSPVFLPVCVTYLSIFLVGVLGNSLTCAVILRYKVMQTPTNYYLLSLAASDLLVLLLGMPLELYEMWQNYPFLFGEGGCYFKTFLFETVCFASVLNVTALSVERYLAVAHPLKVKYVSTSAHVKRVVFALWSLSMLCSVPNTSLHGIVTLPPQFGRDFPRSAICQLVKPRWMYNLIILISTLVFFILPMLIISILYLLIGLQLHREKTMTTTVEVRCSFGPESLSKAHARKVNKRNLQVTKMLCVLVMVFGLCWAPFHADRLMWSLMDASLESHLQIFEHVHIVSGVFFYLSAAVNPVLYNLMSTRFREMFRHVCCSGDGWSLSSGLEMSLRASLSHKAREKSKWTPAAMLKQTTLNGDG